MPGSLVGVLLIDDRRKSVQSPRQRNARLAAPRSSVVAALRDFIHTEAASGLVLLAATIAALVWTNAPFHDTYARLWHHSIAINVGALHFDEDLRHVVNDSLMALFFFVVGMEIKRELVDGELADLRVASLPLFAAVGGMLVPAAIYAAVTTDQAGGHGWAIPMATDIAFALGVLALLSHRVPNALKLLLLALAIVDDIGVIIVIAFFYGGDVRGPALACAFGAVALALLARRQGIEWLPVYGVLGVVGWFATYKSGVHATIAGVAFGLVTPAAHLEQRLHRFTSFVVLPCFALANAGVSFRRGMFAERGSLTVAFAVAVALVAGKFVGILTGSWLAVRIGVSALPVGVRWRHIAGMAALGGIGFTVSVFVTGLAFSDTAVADAAKVAILAASATAAILGTLILRAPRIGA